MYKWENSCFDDEYTPTKLRNWEIPKWYPERPLAISGSTKTIANEKGWLLPGVPRRNRSPWGNYIGTWHLPTKITREIANELNAPDLELIQGWYEKYTKAPHKLPLVRVREPKIIRELVRESKAFACKKDDSSLEIKENEVAQKINPKRMSPSATKVDNCACKNMKIEDSKETSPGPDNIVSPKMEPRDEIIPQKAVDGDEQDRKKVLYVPGDFTEPHHRHPSHELLVEQTLSPQNTVSNKGYPKYREDFSRPVEPEPQSLKEKFGKFYDKHKKMMCEHIRPKSHRKEKDVSAPYLAASKNFALAKKLHKENLEHVPLPDTITDALYRKVQLDREGDEPGLVLKDGNYATGVGWKGYPGFGANRCTKLRIFRPKTAGERPPSICNFDKKWRFIRQHKVTPIELAIYWDMTPINRADEPRRPFHIDGTDFSGGPAVFHNISTPKDADNDPTSTPNTELSNKNALFTNLAQTERPKTSWEKQKNGMGMRRAKSAANVNPKIKSSCSSATQSFVSVDSSTNRNQKAFYQSTPNLADRSPMCTHPCQECLQQIPKVTHSKFCSACELKARRLNIQAARPKSDFKMAFKAGVPNSDPKGKRDDYPEHWRLASVYQHSYKPVHIRKRPLLATVYQ